MGLIVPHLPQPQKRKFHLLGVDVTPYRRQFAHTLADRGYVYYPNAIQGNRPVTVGINTPRWTYCQKKKDLMPRLGSYP